MHPTGYQNVKPHAGRHLFQDIVEKLHEKKKDVYKLNYYLSDQIAISILKCISLKNVVNVGQE